MIIIQNIQESRRFTTKEHISALANRNREQLMEILGAAQPIVEEMVKVKPSTWRQMKGLFSSMEQVARLGGMSKIQQAAMTPFRVAATRIGFLIESQMMPLLPVINQITMKYEAFVMEHQEYAAWGSLIGAGVGAYYGGYSGMVAGAVVGGLLGSAAELLVEGLVTLWSGIGRPAVEMDLGCVRQKILQGMSYYDAVNACMAEQGITEYPSEGGDLPEPSATPGYGSSDRIWRRRTGGRRTF